MIDIDIKTMVTVLSSLGTVGSFLYCKNEQFYLFVQRILLKFKKLDKAFLDIKISFIVNDDEIFQKLETVNLENAKLNVISKKIKYTEIGNIREFDILVSETAYHQNQILISSKYPIYSIDYEREFENIREIHNKLKASFSVISTNIDFVLSFEGSNPYESFFVKQMPSQNIKNFKVELEIDSVQIEARKNKIISRSKNIDKLIFNVQKILTFKTPITTA